jgi:acetyl esterase
MVTMLERARALRTQMRQRAGALLVDGFFRGVSSAGRLHPRANPRRHRVEVLKDIPYLEPSTLPEHRLDIYRSTATPGPYPVVLYIHGGGFRILSKDSHWLMGLIFARRGFLVFNISYRLAPRHPFPCAVEDTFAAFEWVLNNAEKYGGDVSRLVVAGESAGGNLATALTLATCYRRKEEHAARVFARRVVPKVVVPACAILQVTDCARFRRNGNISTFIADRLSEVSGAYVGHCESSPDPEGLLELADPLRVFERGEKPDRPLPPFFAPCGTADPLIDDTRRLKRALDRMGVECAAPEFEGEHHAFHAFIFREPALRCWRETFEFVGPRVGIDPRATPDEST